MLKSIVNRPSSSMRIKTAFTWLKFKYASMYNYFWYGTDCTVEGKNNLFGGVFSEGKMPMNISIVGRSPGIYLEMIFCWTHNNVLSLLTLCAVTFSQNPVKLVKRRKNFKTPKSYSFTVKYKLNCNHEWEKWKLTRRLTRTSCKIEISTPFGVSIKLENVKLRRFRFFLEHVLGFSSKL